MAQIALHKVLLNILPIEDLLSWVISLEQEEGNDTDVSKFECSRSDFVTYFINFIHDTLPSNDKTSETIPKINKPRKADRKQSNIFNSSNATDINKKFNERPNEVDIHRRFNDRLFNSPDNCSKSFPTSSPQNSSTPKNTTTLSRNCDSSDYNYMNSVSPIHRGQSNFSTTGGSNSNQKLLHRNTSLSLSDFIVPARKASSKKKSHKVHCSEDGSNQEKKTIKRINPTNLNEKKFNSFENSDNSYDFRECTKHNQVENYEQERNFRAIQSKEVIPVRDDDISLKPEKIEDTTEQKNFTQVQCTETISKRLDNERKSDKMNNFVNNIEMKLDPELVTFQEEIDKIIKIYVTLMNNNLVLNVASELYFIISLLFGNCNFVKMDYEQSNAMHLLGVDILNSEETHVKTTSNSHKEYIELEKPEALFTNVHNVVYFSSKTLQNIVGILKSLDKSTIKQISENPSLKLFAPNFAVQLNAIALCKTERVRHLYDSESRSHICFILDTDNRLNFPNDSSFQVFKKQRDLFYEILKIWEENRMIVGWDFAYRLTGKIKSLVNLHNEPLNVVHLSRLFRMQLLSACGKNDKEEGISEKYLPSLSTLNIDRAKLDRLKSRLVTKQASSGINCSPTFCGYQEFYKDFIITASNYSFNKHLSDALVAEMLALNETKFMKTELETSENDVDPETKKSFVNCLRSLRIMAKFLGLVESLPYKTETSNYSEHLMNAQIKIRQNVMPSLDLRSILHNAISNKSITLTIPWICKYLSMLDLVTLKLPYYVSVIKILIGLYRNFDVAYPEYNVHLVKFNLGWLFELNNFPQDQVVNYSTRRCEYFALKSHPNGEMSQTDFLDNLHMVDQNILYIFCPYLDEIKKLLTTNTVANSRLTMRHITPLTAVESPLEVSMKKLEVQLQEAFFNGQPLSLRKTVDFVAERIASSCVKHICNTVVPTYKKKGVDVLVENLTIWMKESIAFNILKAKANELKHEQFKRLQAECKKETINIVNENLTQAIQSLLPTDALPKTKTTCIAIASKMCVERVRQWVNSHVVLGILTKDYDEEISRCFNGDNKKIKSKATFALPAGGSSTIHDSNTTSAAHMLAKLQDYCIKILHQNANINEDIVTHLLNELHSTLTKRNDVNECITFAISNLLLDFTLLIVTRRPHLMENDRILRRLTEIWNVNKERTADIFSNILCVRNITMLTQSSAIKQSWTVLGKFLAFLVKENIINCDNFESQCTGLFKNNLDAETLKNVSVFLDVVGENYKKSTGNTDKFILLLEFLSDYCADL